MYVIQATGKVWLCIFLRYFRSKYDVPNYIFEEFLENISSLTEEGKVKARTYVEDLASIDKYRIPDYKSIRREKKEP